MPDIVTMGKPMANGHPVGGVVTTQAIMTRFREAFRYFNTFGGNPVSCAAAMALLEEMEAEGLQAQATRVGAYCQDKLVKLGEKHACISDIRGGGMIFGAELVTSRDTEAPASALCAKVVNEIARPRHFAFKPRAAQEHAENSPAIAV